jgi:hypothetical protein
MAQHDYNIDNQAFPATRADINSAFGAVATNNSGATAPVITYEYMWWLDTSTDDLKMLNAAKTAWIDFAHLDTTNDRVELRTNVIQAVSGAGITLKNLAGSTILSVGDTGLITTVSSITVGGNITVSGTVDGVDIAAEQARLANTSGTNTGDEQAASETVKGVVDLATTAEGNTGTDPLLVPPVAVVTSMIATNRASNRFTSSAQTITAGGSLTIAHGLSAAPTVVTAWIKCLTAGGGYSVGDEVFVVVQGASNEASSSNKGVSIVRDATNLTVRFGSSPNTFQPLKKTTGIAYNSFVNASWEIYFHAMI